MIFQSYLSERLRTSVDRMIYFKDFTPPSSLERLVPTASFFLVIELDGIARHLHHNQSLVIEQSVSGGWISGLQKQFRTISAHPESEMLAVQFTPLGACRFLPLPLTQFENRVLSARAMLGEDFDHLRAKLLVPGSPEMKFQVMEDWLVAREKEPPDSARELAKVLVGIQREQASPIASLVRQYPSSHRQFIADFKNLVGTTPKFYQRIVRFASLLASIELKDAVNWADLASLWGFSDQSHLVREFSYFSGFVPTEFIEQDHQLTGTNFFPLVKNRQDGTPVVD